MRIGLAMDRRGGPSELMLRGIAAYARPARPWVFSWDNPSAEGILRLLELEPDGLLVKHVDERGFELIERAGVPDRKSVV